MKEHRNSFKFDRGSKANQNRTTMYGMKHSLDVPDLRLEPGKVGVLSLSFRKDMEQCEQYTSDTKWDLVYSIFRKYMKKITRKEYSQIFYSVHV